jgi:tetratricopeptide (TPR) repeat protein
VEKVRHSAAWFEGKIARLEARIGRRPKNAQLYQGLGKAMLELGYERPGGRCGDAEAAFRRSLELADDPWTHLYLANIYYGQQLYDQSLAAAKRAHELMPKVDMPLVCMADAYACMRKYAQADECFRKAVEVDPDSEIGRKNLKKWLAFWVPEQARRRAVKAEGGRRSRHRMRGESQDE